MVAAAERAAAQAHRDVIASWRSARAAIGVVDVSSGARPGSWPACLLGALLEITRDLRTLLLIFSILFSAPCAQSSGGGEDEPKAGIRSDTA